MRKSGTRLRITAQLIDVDDGFHLWSETYDRELTDVFAVQDEITAAIIAALSLHFDTGESPAVAEVAETNLSAYDAYLQGRHQLRGFSTTDLRAALTSFRAATDADPEFAAAWAARASTVTLLRETDFTEGIPTAESRLLARAAIDRALAIDPDLAEAYVAEGLLHEDAYRFEEALQSLEHALEINANLAEAWTWRSRILGRFGRIQESREDMLKALQLDPHNETTAILAANLLEDFYEPDFFAAVEKNGSQFARVRQILQELRMSYIETFTSESYRRIEATPDLPPFTLAGTKLFFLKELDAETLYNASRYKGEFLMWLYMSTEHWDEAQAIYDGLTPERQQSDLNLEELSIMLTSQGRCEEALENLDRAHDGDIRVLGLIGPNGGRSNSNLALNRVYCLRQLGRPDEADQVLSLVREYVDTLRENTVYGIYIVDAKLRILDGDTDAALDVLEAAYQREEFDWNDRYDPILRTIGDQPRFQALSDEIDRGIDELRAELGMPPAEL